MRVCRLPCKVDRETLWIQDLDMTFCFIWSSWLGPCYIKDWFIHCYEDARSQLKSSISSLLEDKRIRVKINVCLGSSWDSTDPEVLVTLYRPHGLLTLFNSGILMQMYLTLLNFVALLSQVSYLVFRFHTGKHSALSWPELLYLIQYVSYKSTTDWKISPCKH